MTEAKTMKVTLVGSAIGLTARQRQTLLGLGLKRRGRSVTVCGDQPTLGMIRKLAHILKVES